MRKYTEHEKFINWIRTKSIEYELEYEQTKSKKSTDIAKILMPLSIPRGMRNIAYGISLFVIPGVYMSVIVCVRESAVYANMHCNGIWTVPFSAYQMNNCAEKRQYKLRALRNGGNG